MKFLNILPLAALLLAPSFAHAKDPVAPSDDAEAYVGAIALLNSEYLGSDDKELRPLPYASFRNLKGFDLFGTNLTYRAVETGTGEGLGKWSLRAGPSLGYEGGRDSDDSETLTGLDDIGGSVMAGGFIRSTIGPVGLQLNAGQDIAGGHGGVTANASIGTFLPLGRVKIQPSASLNWGSAEHNQNFFGITQAQSAASGLAFNDVDSGIYGYSVNLVSWVEISDDYIVTLIGTHRWFTGDANDSPILLAEDGADTGIFVALGVARRFDISQW